jgi:ABC-type oligopeptide transport system ATPase subunit
MTMLTASHDLAMVQEAFPRVVIMDEGVIVSDGPTDQLLKDQALLRLHGLSRI